MFCFNTSWGHYRSKRLPFGTVDAYEIFHRYCSEQFEGLSEVVVDDLMIFVATEEEHDKKVVAVLNKARMIGRRLNPGKVQLKQTSVKFLGHTISWKGVDPDPEKIKAIVEMPAPTNRQGVMRLLGMVNYLAKFVNGFADLTSPLRKLTHEDTDFQWDANMQAAFDKTKASLALAPTVQYFDPSLPTLVQTDAIEHWYGWSAASKEWTGCILLLHTDGYAKELHSD